MVIVNSTQIQNKITHTLKENTRTKARIPSFHLTIHRFILLIIHYHVTSSNKQERFMNDNLKINGILSNASKRNKLATKNQVLSLHTIREHDQTHYQSKSTLLYT